MVTIVVVSGTAVVVSETAVVVASDTAVVVVSGAAVVEVSDALVVVVSGIAISDCEPSAELVSISSSVTEEVTELFPDELSGVVSGAEQAVKSIDMHKRKAVSFFFIANFLSFIFISEYI